MNTNHDVSIYFPFHLLINVYKVRLFTKQKLSISYDRDVFKFNQS